LKPAQTPLMRSMRFVTGPEGKCGSGLRSALDI
jgi:hypothetical protein